MKIKIWIDCGICCRTHEASIDDCRAFSTCPFCGDAYHIQEFDTHIAVCKGIALSTLPEAIFIEEDVYK